MARTRLASVAVLISVAAAMPARAATYDRLYLLGNGSASMVWSVDKDDAEAQMSSITKTCGLRVSGVGNRHPCGPIGIRPQGSDTHLFHSVKFLPSSTLDQDVVWNAANPLRFHVEATVDIPVPFSLSLVMSKAGAEFESGPATQISEGVFDGALTTGSPLPARGAFTLFGLRIRSVSPSATVTVKLRGASYIQLPSPVAARSVRDMVGANTYRPNPTRFETTTKTFTFNDDQWSAWSFTGDLTDTRTFEAQMPRDAEFVIAWAESFDSPFTYDLVQNHEADSRKITDSPVARLLWEGLQIQHSSNGSGQRGRGQDTIAALSVPTGLVELEVSSLSGAQGVPYEAHVLAVYGKRTLSRIRWAHMFPYLEPAVPHRSPVSSVCPNLADPVPVTDEVSTFTIDVDWETVSPSLQKWTPGYGTNAFVERCGDESTADRIRVVHPGKAIWQTTPALAHDSNFASVRDTRFEMQVDYVYTPA